MDRNEQKLKTTGRVKAFSPTTVLKWLLRILQGALIGAGAILPGVSGGAMCVVFGIYRPMMALLAHPFRTFKKYARLLFPVLIGWAIGFVGLARLVDILFKANSSIAIWLFVGLIAGMTPSLFNEAGKEGRPKSAWVSLILSTAIILGVLLLMQGGSQINLQPNIWWYFVCGIVWGTSLVIPGLSSSSLLIFLGLYEPMTEGIAGLTKGMWGQAAEVIIPMIFGILIFVFISARGINYVFKRYYPIAYHSVIGFVIASTIVIVLPLLLSTINGNAGEILLCVLTFVVGFVGARLMDRMNKKIQSRPELNEQL